MSDAVFVIGRDMKILYANPASESLTGYASDESVGRHCHEIFCETSDLCEEGCPPKRAMRESKPIIRKDGETRSKSGEIKQTQITILPFNEGGRCLGSVIVMKDVTELKTAEKKLRESENFLKTIIETEPECVKLLACDGTLLMMNRAGLSMIEADSLEQVKGKSVYPLVAGEYRQAFQKLTDDVFLGNAGALEFEMVGIKGKRLVLETNAVPLRNEKKEIIALLGITRDVTERRKIETELLNVQRLESLGILAGGIAHDFNNLLTAILGNISLAKTLCDSGSVIYRGLAEAEKASLRARDLTRQLLTFSKGGTPIKNVSPLDGIVKDAATFASRGSNVRCEFSLPADLWPVEVDAGQIRQALNNIVINACEAMPQGGTILIRCCNIIIGRKNVLPLAEGRYAQISVRDEGTGIPKEFLPRVFDPYFTTKQKGSGLGLATAYSIIKRHGGYLSVESKMGAGSTFHLYLPAAAEKQTETVDARAEVGPRKGRILVMDDQTMVREVAGALLQSLGYQVELAADGEDAAARYLAGKESGCPFDAVIMDLTVPGGMGGAEAIKKLLAIDPSVKAIVSSGYANDSVIADFRAHGFKGIILKPYKIKELSNTLRDVLSSAD
jgi:two-component system cell cycle sensor histidine kinase/response regulator CckA